MYRKSTIAIFLRENVLRARKKSFVCYVIFVANSFENSNAFDFSLSYFLQIFVRTSEDISIVLHAKRAEYLNFLS